MLCIFGLIIDNTSVNLVVILVKMRWKANNQFVKECSDTINVCTFIMTLSHQNFRTHVLGRTTKTVAPLFLLYNLAQSEVCNLEMAINID